MDEKSWKERVGALRAVRMRGEAEKRIRLAIDRENASAHQKSHRDKSRYGWWIATTVVAAGLIVAVVTRFPSQTSPGVPGSNGGSAKPLTVLDLLPKSGIYADQNGVTQKWVVTRSGSKVTLEEYDSGPGPSPSSSPTYIYDMAIQDGCLVQLDVRMTSGAMEAEKFPWYCVPAKRFTASYDNADYHVTDKATESLSGPTLTVKVARQDGPTSIAITRVFTAGKGLVGLTQTSDGSTSTMGPVPTAFQSLPLFKTVTDQPFGAYSVQIPARLLAAPGLSFATYLPTISKLYPQGFSSQTVTMGAASGVIFGDPSQKAMYTEVMFLPKGTSKSAAVANMREAEATFQPAPYDVTTWKQDVTPYYQSGQTHWIITEDTGSNPKDATIYAAADLGEYQAQYFYIITTGWYERDGLPIMSDWRWANGTSFDQGVTKVATPAH